MQNRLFAALALLTASSSALMAADLVITGAKVMTMDPALPFAEAIAITGDKITAIGSASDLASEITAETQVFDLKGALVLPGFQDAHTHVAWSGAELQDISLWDAATLDDLATAISDGAKGQEPWVRGTGWDLSAFPDLMLDRTFLDTLVPDRPAYFAAADGHSAWVNSKALELAGITAETKDPDGGRIERDATGAPQGLLRESAVALVADLMPAYSHAQVDTGLAEALAEANSYGITAIIDPKADDWMLEGYQRALDAGKLTVRVRAAVEVTDAAGIAGVIERRSIYASNMLSVNAVKVFVDGVIEAKTAAMITPYVDDTTGGELMVAPDELNKIAIAADAAGLQLHFHAIGDLAVRVALDAIAAAEATNGKHDLRHQLAHLEVIDPADIPRFAALGAIANFQSLWAYPDSYITDLTEPVIGPERSEWLYPIGAVLTAGGMIVGGSDWSVSSMNPLDAIQVGVTRQDPDDPTGRVLTPQHKVSLDDMLKAYTINAAYAGFREVDTGSLSVGKLADIVVLDRDITAGPDIDIAKTKVLLTLLGGRAVYTAVGVVPTKP
ncbi:MAG: amidohydrolase [Deltaproteobacteria bacterium]